MFENSYSILDLLGWLFVGVAIGACLLYFALWLYAVRRASGLTKRPPDVCNASDCKEPAVCAGLCEKHSF